MATTMTRLIFLFIAISASGQVLGDLAWVEGTVDQLLVDDRYYGTCMVKVAPGPEAILPSCASNWVTFSCSGDFNSKSTGNLKFQSAQLAFLTGKKVAFYIDDSKKHNGYCFIQRLYVYQ